MQHMFATPELKCFESDAQTINYRRQWMEGARRQGVKVSTPSVLCQYITSTGS